MVATKHIWVVWLLLCSTALAREWKDSAGRTMDAELVTVDGTTAVLKKSTGEVRFPIDRLSEADRKYIRDWQSRGAGTKSAQKPLGNGLVIDGKPLVAGGKVGWTPLSRPKPA